METSLNAEPNSAGGVVTTKIMLIIVSILLFALGIVAIAGGALVLYWNSATDGEGYFISPVHEVRSSANAFALWVAPMQSGSTFSWLGEDNIAQTKWIIKSVDSGTQVFAGWTKAASGEAYLSQFRYETPDKGWHWRIDAYYAEIDIPSTKIVNQGAPPRTPADEIFWTDSAVTADSATIYWDPSWEQSAGMNIIILMNADGTAGVDVDLQLGFKVPILTWLPYLLIPLGILLCLAGYLLFKRR